MFARFVCALLGFRAREFPEKSEKTPGNLLLTKGHMEEKAVLEDLIKYSKKNFGELVTTRGKNHSLLGININITEDKFFEI